MNSQKRVSLFVVALITGIFGLTVAAKASTVGITNASTLGAFDTFDWSQIGPQAITVSSPQNVVSNGGMNASVSSAGNALQTLIEGNSFGWSGNFAPGVSVLWDAAVGPDITLTFANPVSGAGAQIQSDFGGNFTAQITAFDKNGATLGSFSEKGVATENNDDSAIFIGLLDNSADIAKIQFILTDATSSPNDFAIGSADFSGTGVSETPLPSAFLLFASAVTGLGFYGRRRVKNLSA
jgi:hypothetical protein